MDEMVFGKMLEEIYSTFGRGRPEYNSATYRGLKRRVDEASIPNEAARFIGYAFADYDSLPLNLGKAILREFQNWLSENPQRRAQDRACPECCQDFPGFFWANDGGQDYLCKCACNTDPRWDRQRAWTHRQAREAGLFIGTRLGGHADTAPASLHGIARQALGHSEAPRPMHQQQRDYHAASSW